MAKLLQHIILVLYRVTPFYCHTDAVMLNDVILSVISLNIISMSVVAPIFFHKKKN